MWISRRWEMIPVASFMRVKAETSHSEGLNFLLLCRVQQLRVQSGFVANVRSMRSHCRIKDSTVFTQVGLVFSLQTEDKNNSWCSHETCQSQIWHELAPGLRGPCYWRTSLRNARFIPISSNYWFKHKKDVYPDPRSIGIASKGQ